MRKKGRKMPQKCAKYAPKSPFLVVICVCFLVAHAGFRHKGRAISFVVPTFVLAFFCSSDLMECILHIVKLEQMVYAEHMRAHLDVTKTFASAAKFRRVSDAL